MRRLIARLFRRGGTMPLYKPPQDTATARVSNGRLPEQWDHYLDEDTLRKLNN